jgi:hypothetical protein
MMRLLLLACVALGCSQSKAPQEKDGAPAVPAKVDTSGRFSHQSARIVFEHRGWKQGTIEAWIADGGTAVVLVSDLQRPIRERKTLVWKDGKTLLWDLASPEPVVSSIRHRPRSTLLRLVGANTPELLEKAGYVRKGDQVVAGKRCAVWRNDEVDVTLWRWQGIDLKYVNGAVKHTKSVMEAVSVEVDVAVPESIYEPPRDLPIRDHSPKDAGPV